MSFDAYTRFGVKDIKGFIKLIEKDSAFGPFHLNNKKYVISRIGGNLVTSIHRKLGDIYEDLTQEILSQKLKISRSSLEYAIEIIINNQRQNRSTDGRILISEIKETKTLEKIKEMTPEGMEGIALEVRSCYQIGDSKRIQADRDMALALKEVSLSPIMLIYCDTSLKSPVARLSKIWTVKEGADAFDYLKQLTDFDLAEFLKDNSSFIELQMKEIFDML